MPEKLTVEMIVGKPGRREGEGGTDLPAPSKGREVEGHHPHNANVICPHCGAHRVVEADTNFTKWFTCGHCGRDYYY